MHVKSVQENICTVHVRVHCTWYKYIMPYSAKFSWSKIFANRQNAKFRNHKMPRHCAGHFNNEIFHGKYFRVCYPISEIHKDFAK